MGSHLALLRGPSSLWAQGPEEGRRAQQNSTVPDHLAPSWARLPARLRPQVTPFQGSLRGETQIQLRWVERDPLTDPVCPQGLWGHAQSVPCLRDRQNRLSQPHSIDKETETQRGLGSGWALAEARFEPRSLSPMPVPGTRTPPRHANLTPRGQVPGQEGSPQRPVLRSACLHIPARPCFWHFNVTCCPAWEAPALGLPSHPGGVRAELPLPTSGDPPDGAAWPSRGKEAPRPQSLGRRGGAATL